MGHLLGLVPRSSLGRRLEGCYLGVSDPVFPTHKHASAGNLPSACPQKLSYRVALVSLVPSDSPPGLTHTNASASSSPVLPVGRTPKPAPLTLHQSPPGIDQATVCEIRIQYTGLLTLSTEASNSVATGVDDGMVGHAVLLQERREGAVKVSGQQTPRPTHAR